MRSFPHEALAYIKIIHQLQTQPYETLISISTTAEQHRFTCQAYRIFIKAMEPSDRVLLVAVDDSEGSEKAFMWAIENVYRDGDSLHLVHVVPRLAFAAQYGVPPVDFVPAADSSGYESAVQRAEQFIIDRFVKALPSSVKAPVVHIIKVRSLTNISHTRHETQPIAT